VSFSAMENVRKKSGRMDILISELGDFVTILEIKATDWDRIKPRNIRRNLWRHQKQLFAYVDTCIEVDKLDVCLGIIYPRPPKTPGLRERIEACLEGNYGVPAYWYTEIRTGTPTEAQRRPPTDPVEVTQLQRRAGGVGSDG